MNLGISDILIFIVMRTDKFMGVGQETVRREEEVRGGQGKEESWSPNRNSQHGKDA